LASKLLRDIIGSSLIEFTIVFPVFMLVAFGTVDVTYMLYEWALANKAAYIGVHTAIISNPVAAGITNLNNSYQQILIGSPCFDNATGNNTSCPSLTATCTAAASGGTCTCTGTGGGCLGFTAFDDVAFANIFNRMKEKFSRLQRQNVRISYVTNNLGFVGRPDGLPMDVTVSITGVTHQIYFLGDIIRFFGGTFAANPSIPAFASTLTSEDMVTN
jgi:TadE-like protein